MKKIVKSIFYTGLVLTMLALTAQQSLAASHNYSVAVLKDAANNKTIAVADKLMSALSCNNFTADFITYENLCSKNSFKKYDCLVITDSTRFPAQARDNLSKFLKRGSDMVLLGGLAFKENLSKVDDKWTATNQPPAQDIQPLELPVFEDRSIYYFKNAPSIVTYKKQQILKSQLKIKGSYTGISAIAFEYPEVSRYTPLLAVQDKYSRNIGFAGGLLVNYSGDFKNSHWLLFGIESPDFYCSKQFLDVTIELLNRISKKDLPKKFAKEDRSDEKKCLPITSPPPSVFITLSKDKKHFLLPDGRKFFAIGCNYIGPFERKCEYGEDYFNSKRLEQDFKKAKAAGVNAFRFWNFRIENNPKRLKTIIELARKYGIYLILHPRSHPLPTEKKLIKVFQKSASLVNNEPIVLGYDLMNEPYVTTVGSISINGQKSEILKHKSYEKYSADYFDKKWVDKLTEQPTGWPELGKWIKNSDAKNIYAAYEIFKKYIQKFNPPQDYSCLFGLDGKLPIEDNYKEFISSLDKTFKDWILFHQKAITKFGNNHFITVGYNTSLAALPTNNLLDFVSHHIYQKPHSFQDMQKSITTFDRLRKFWPDKPITLGEFGFTSGLKLPDGSYLTPQAASVAEMIIYLYAFANDYSGAYLWTLSEWPIANMKYNAPWISKDRHKYESRFGMYSYDGTPQGQPKPIAHATSFFRQYIDTHQPGQGTFQLTEADTQIKTGYVFTDKDALFVGNTKYNSKRLKFQSSLPVNVMLMWNAKQLKAMATGDVEIEINPSEFGFSNAVELSLQGQYDLLQKTNNVIKLKLLKGQAVTFSLKKDQNETNKI